MIGPSSSHTAGALNISLLARKMIKEKILSVSFVLYGSFAKTYKGHGTDKALVAGVLGFKSDDPRIKHSFSHAKENNVEFKFSENLDNNDVHPNTVDLYITGEKGTKLFVRGVSLGGGYSEIIMIDNVKVKISGEYCTLFIRQIDEPGVVAYITTILSGHNINIAFMRLYRENKGEKAYTIIEVDTDIPDIIVKELEKNVLIISAIIIRN